MSKLILPWLFLGMIATYLPLFADNLNSTSTSWEDQEEIKYIESPRSVGMDIQYSPVTYPKYNYVGATSNKNGVGGYFSLEWLAWQKYGKVGLGGSTGFFVLPDVDRGDGTFASLYTVPIQAFVTYRFDYLENQFLIPFVKLGPEMEIVTQGSGTGGGRSGIPNYYGFDYGGGIAFCLNALEPSSANTLDSRTGINGTYLTLEAQVSLNLNGAGADPDLSRTEFRAGLRLEM